MVKLSLPTVLRRRTKAQSAQSGVYRILFTRGDEVIEAPAYRGAFEQALERSLVSTGEVSDFAAGKAYAAAMTGYACVEYKAKTAAGIPLEVVNGVRGADETPLDGTPLDYFLSISAKIIADWQRSHDIWGRTYLRKRYNTRGYPTGLVWLNPLDVYEYTDRGVVTGYRWQNPAGGSEALNLQEVIFAQAFDARSNGNGLSKFEAAWLALNIDANLSTYAAAFFLNGAQIDGFLSFEGEPSADAYEKAKQDWKRAFQGAKNAHRTAVMPSGAKWNPISAAPKDLAMTDLKGAEREDICAVFEVDPALVHLKDTGDPLSANSTYSSIEIAHIRNVTLPFLRTVILPALNDQWAMRDFGAPYRIDIDEQNIPALQAAQFVRADTANTLAAGSLLDYQEARDLLGYGEREDYLKRSPLEPLSLWNAGGVTLNELQRLVYGVSSNDPNLDVVLIGGQYIPRSRILEVANANADALKQPAAPSPFGNLPPGGGNGGVTVLTPPAPQLPPSPTQAMPAERVDDHSLCAMLFFQPNDPALLGLQNRLRELYPDAEWTPTDALHVTVFYAPDATDMQAARFSAVLAGMTPPELALAVGSLHSFDNVGEHALHFRVKRNADLMDYQERVFDAAQEIGILASPYSAPDAYIPHITMGYLKERARAVTYSGKANVRPVVMRLMYGETCVHERPLLVDQPARRSTSLPLQLAVSLADNQFVRYARRILSDALTEQGLSAEWVDEDAWRVVLAQSDDWTPGELSALIKRADYAEVGRVDARLSGYASHEGGLYAVIDASPVMLMKGAALDLRAAGLEPVATVSGQYLMLGMSDADVTEFPPVDFPIVLNNVTAFVGDTAYHAWTLRSASPAELKELTNWERVVTRKGRDYDFRVETLPDGLRDYVRSRLLNDDPIDGVFADARAKLVSGDSVASFLERWDESQHPRQPDGKFGTGGGSGGSSGDKPSRPKLDRPLDAHDLIQSFDGDQVAYNDWKTDIQDYTDAGYNNIATSQRLDYDQWYEKTGGTQEQYRASQNKAMSIESGLRKMPVYDGDIYRGIEVGSLSDIQGGTIEVGGTLQLPALSSFSRNASNAENFGQTGVLFHVKGNNSGVEISSISVTQREAEVLVPSQTAYRITAVNERGAGWLVEMEEIT